VSRKIDALIAEHVFGWSTMVTGLDLRPIELIEKAEDDIYLEQIATLIKPFSTDIAAAWLVVDALREQRFFSSVTDLTLDSGIIDWIWHFKHYDNVNDDFNGRGKAPMAIALAALKAKGVNVDEVD